MPGGVVADRGVGADAVARYVRELRSALGCAGAIDRAESYRQAPSGHRKNGNSPRANGNVLTANERADQEQVRANRLADRLRELGVNPDED